MSGDRSMHEGNAQDMPAPDEQTWLEDLRERAYDYLARLGIWKVRIQEMPAWHLTPYLCIWAVESEKSPDDVGWWVICGDLPTDCIWGDIVRSPRDAMHAIGARWLEAAAGMKRGEARPVTWTGIEECSPLLMDMLESRGGFLISWAGDDGCWDLEYAPS
jgi:hypothetical protein